MKRFLSLAFISIAFTSSSLANENVMCDTRHSDRVLRFPREWKFSVGDDPAWADPAFDDRDWGKISVPNAWEREGYRHYDGFAWYRVSFKTPKNTTGQLFVALGEIDDADEAYLNGTLVGGLGMFPPHYKTAWGQGRAYPISKDLLNPDGENVLAVRVYDGEQEGGIRSGRVGIYESRMPAITANLEGKWLFRAGDNLEWAQPETDTTDFQIVTVPSLWDDFGYKDYDGIGWYRKTFSVDPGELQGQMVMLLGKIDDMDQVYLNGELIGATGDFEQPSTRAYNHLRNYYFPASLLTQQNTIAVRVYDLEHGGGIYQGPLAIVTQKDYIDYWEERRKENTLLNDIRNLFE
ncbi:beta galactosidase jelly roll domain-containing protein [Pelagicoccus sp. SDUM812003]|uniref:beta galactosidase jelly roll domain-containing protein n=1 Tax=Pelagicoccus sp. SDUM812003 TaxID=3041267 RepID=UPI00280DDAF6|nr:beta galactosidase jelly roll domain-containing protein [Pelagicoccus sp. SDUM812003]MDQ8202744.1 beta galactosidase jelly roll domain-containing protein [Pelagicoccus sp. SDUM812003]